MKSSIEVLRMMDKITNLRGNLGLLFLGLSAYTLLCDESLENSSVSILRVSKVKNFYRNNKQNSLQSDQFFQLELSS